MTWDPPADPAQRGQRGGTISQRFQSNLRWGQPPKRLRPRRFCWFAASGECNRPFNQRLRLWFASGYLGPKVRVVLIETICYISLYRSMPIIIGNSLLFALPLQFFLSKYRHFFNKRCHINMKIYVHVLKNLMSTNTYALKTKDLKFQN